jgi:hypothetical protein
MMQTETGQGVMSGLRKTGQNIDAALKTVGSLTASFKATATHLSVAKAALVDNEPMLYKEYNGYGNDWFGGISPRKMILSEHFTHCSSWQN